MIAALALLATLPAGLVDALMRDSNVATCEKTQSDYSDSVESPPAYLNKAFTISTVTLRSGEHMTVLVGATACLARGQSTRVYIYQRTPAGYRKVLDSVTMGGDESVGRDGTATLPTHDTIETIMESEFVWNGNTYAFAPLRSTMYDIAVEKRLPYQTAIHFAPGADSATLTGQYALNFGREYVFGVRKGQRITVDVLSHSGKLPSTSIWVDDSEVDKDLGGGRATAIAPRDGTYSLLVFGTADAYSSKLETFQVRLTIH